MARKRAARKNKRSLEFLTHPVWVRQLPPQANRAGDGVSIHPLRVECDPGGVCLEHPDSRFNPRTPCGVRHVPAPGRFCRVDVSIHAPRVECDTFPPRGGFVEWMFQSTHSVWSATSPRAKITLPGDGFNPRTPCGVRLSAAVPSLRPCCFNPRTPCGVRPAPPS